MTIGKYFVFIFFLIGLSSQLLIAQSRYSKPEEYSIINGLPNNEVRCIHKDSKGYIWIGTLYGLAKFDGNKFTIFRHESNSNSISGDVITAIYEDDNGNILVGANGLSIFERKTGNWKNYLHNPNNELSVSNPGVTSITQENDSIYWIITYSGINRFNINTGQFNRLNFQPNTRLFSSKIIAIDPNKFISFQIGSTFYKYNLRKDTVETLSVDYNNEYNSISFFKGNMIGLKHTKFSGYELVVMNLQFKEQRQILSINDGSCTQFQDNDYLYVICSNKLYVLNSDLTIVDEIRFHSQNFSSKSKVDYYCGLREQNGIVWIGTSEGLYKILPQSSFHILDGYSGLTNSYIRSLMVDRENDLIVGVKQGPAYRINNIDNLLLNKLGRIERIDYPSKTGTTYATNQIVELTNGNLLFVTQDTLYYYDAQKRTFTDKLQVKSNKQYFSALEIKSGLLVGSLEKPTLFKVEVNANQINYGSSFKIKNIPDAVYTIYKDCNDQVWIGGEGLYALTFSKDSNSADISQVIPSINGSNFVNNSVWNILEIDSSKLIVCTTTNGFYVYNKSTNAFQHFTSKDGLSSDFICAVLKDHHQNIWMSTKEGVSSFDTKHFALKNHSVKDGSRDCDFNFKCCAKTNSNILLFGSKQGIVYFNPDSIMQDTLRYPLLINEFKVFDSIVKRELSTGDTILLRHDENFFSFEFSMLDFRNPDEIKYKYQLLNYQKQERTITDGANVVTYTDVPPGEYKFKLTGLYSTNSNNSQLIEVVVIIKPAFYQTLIFKLLMFVMLVAIVGVVLLFYIRRKFLRGQLYKMELDLLRAQINPHFIFNTLTSIQHTIIANDKNVAVEQLAKFSRLMRMCLDYSRLDYIPLDKALNFYKTYVAVESVNLDEAIDFQITIEKTIDPAILEVSPMLIQPFIENAIVHGLAPKNKNMKLFLSINILKDVLSCTIEDNGIGREKASEIAKNKAKAHKSMGIEISKKSILLQMKDNVFKQESLIIIDKYNENGIPAGTKVNLKIPYRLNHQML